MRYVNFHKHTHQSNVRTIDCVVKPYDYINRALELGHKHYSTVEHGWCGNFLENYELCKKNGLDMIYGAEVYIVKDRHPSIVMEQIVDKNGETKNSGMKEVKDSSNQHMVIIAKDKEGFYQLNDILSESNRTGFYYKNRVDLELLSRLNPDLFFVTSACVGGIVSKKYDLSIFNFVKDYFKGNFYLEVQPHVDIVQASHNEIVLELSNKHNIPLIHANDSHYIYPKQAEDRDLLLKGKGMVYEDESGFILDYPDYDEIFTRYKKQGLLSDEQIKQSINNTLVMDECEDLKFNKDIKMPTIYPNQDTKKIFVETIKDKWVKERVNVPKERHPEYLKAIKDECEIVLKTNMQDYFLLNEKIIDIGVNKYDGVLTRTGRGSAVSFYINKLLGFTEIDRLNSEVPLYPTRFMSIARILETKSLPDIDFNTANPKPFIKSSQDVLGDDNVYYMLALGTMKESEAFRNLCRAKGLEMNEFNEIAKDLESYREKPEWKDIIEESKKFIGVIDSVSPSPCSFLLLNESISKEIGLIRVNGELCTCMDGMTSDKWKYLKNDILTVSVWDIISKTFKLIGKPIPSIKELKTMIDDKVWSLYRDGITSTLNQADSDFATALVKRYAPHSVAQYTAFVAAIRPGFASLLDTFLDRQEYSMGVEELDNLLSDSFNMMLYQESIMKFLMWCGIKEEYTYDIIKKIAKKKFEEKELNELKNTLKSNFTEKTNKPDKFDDIWQVIEDAVRYSFNSAHALSVAWDSIYGAYLKANHTIEYYSVILDHYSSDTEKSSKIIRELDYFGIKLKNIKFGKSIDIYTFDKRTNEIHKGIESIKYCNSKIALEMYELRNNKYSHFVDLLKDIKEKTSVDSRQLGILITLRFFSEFGLNKKLLKITEIFNSFNGRKQINKKDLDKLGLTEDLISKYSGKETPALFKELDTDGLIKALCEEVKDEKLGVKEQLKNELENLDYIVTVLPPAKNYYFVKTFKTYKDKKKPYFTLYHIADGEEIKTKITRGMDFAQNPFELGSIIKVTKFKTQNKRKMINGKWTETDEQEQIVVDWEVY